jgi:hypothetical protein
MPRLHHLTRWLWTARTVLPDVLWGLLLIAASASGFVAGLVPHVDACDDRRPLALALGLEAVLLIGAVSITVVRAARYRMSGSTLALVLGVVCVLALNGALWTWLGLGSCWQGFTF